MFDPLRAVPFLAAAGLREPMPQTPLEWLRQPFVHYPLVLGILVLLGLALYRLPEILAWRRGRHRETLRPIDLDPLMHGLPPVILDLRSPAEFNGPKGHIPGAVNVPFRELGKRVHEVAKERREQVVLVDGNDVLSHKAAAMMAADGYTWVRVLRGGMRAWRKACMPVAHPGRRG